MPYWLDSAWSRIASENIFSPSVFCATSIGAYFVHGDGSAIEEGINLAIRISTTEVQPPNLIARLLTTQERLVCASPAYLAAHGVPHKPSNLLQNNCLMLPFQLNDGSDAPIEEIDVSGRPAARTLRPHAPAGCC